MRLMNQWFCFIIIPALHSEPAIYYIDAIIVKNRYYYLKWFLKTLCKITRNIFIPRKNFF